MQNHRKRECAEAVERCRKSVEAAVAQARRIADDIEARLTPAERRAAEEVLRAAEEEERNPPPLAQSGGGGR